MELQNGTEDLGQLDQGDIEINNRSNLCLLGIGQDFLGLQYHQQELGCQLLPDRFGIFKGLQMDPGRLDGLFLNLYL